MFSWFLPTYFSIHGVSVNGFIFYLVLSLLLYVYLIDISLLIIYFWNHIFVLDVYSDLWRFFIDNISFAYREAFISSFPRCMHFVSSSCTFWGFVFHLFCVTLDDFAFLVNVIWFIGKCNYKLFILFVLASFTHNNYFESVHIFLCTNNSLFFYC